jgi:hypothetical protein
MCYKRVYDFAAVQIAPSLRIRPRKSVTMLNPRVPAIEARLPRQNVPRLQLIIMLWLCHAYDELGARHVTRRPWQLLRVTRVIVRTPFPVSYGCADRDWPEIGVDHT